MAARFSTSAVSPHDTREPQHPAAPHPWIPGLVRPRHATGSRVTIREASAGDNQALCRLASACPMQAGIRLCVRREPDFFALNRLQGDRWAVLVAEHPAWGVIGAVGVAERTLWFNGMPSRFHYLGDLKLHPAFRGQGVADQLLTAVQKHCAQAGGGVPILTASLAGNRAIERRVPGGGGLPPLGAIGTIRVHSIFAGAARQGREGGCVRVRPAVDGDLPAMAALWARVAPLRNGAPVLDTNSLAAWIAAAPGLSLGDYLLLHVRGELAGFLGLWDPRRIKQARVLDYGPASRPRRFYNLVARALGWPRLPPAGQPFHALHAVHLCVDPGRPRLLRPLVDAARRRAAAASIPAIELGLDRRDPAGDALRGLLRVGTDVRCYLTMADGGRCPTPDRRPLYFETALV